MKSSFITPKCCARPSVANMDHRNGVGVSSAPVVNRTCLHCGQHWYGEDGVAVVEFTRKAWDHWVNGALDAQADAA